MEHRFSYNYATWLNKSDPWRPTTVALVGGITSRFQQQSAGQAASAAPPDPLSGISGRRRAVSDVQRSSRSTFRKTTMTTVQTVAPSSTPLMTACHCRTAYPGSYSAHVSTRPMRPLGTWMVRWTRCLWMIHYKRRRQIRRCLFCAEMKFESRWRICL